MGVNEQQAMGNKKPSQNWDDLRYFLAVARTGTLSAAAKQLATEHTTVARHIHALEDELNSPLFHKSNNGYELTDAGERLIAGAEAIESAYVFAKAAVSSEGQAITGTVRIGAPDGFGSVFLAPRVRELADRHPRLEIEILPSARLFSLLKREADIAIGLSSPVHMRVVSRRLTDHRLYVYAPRAYLHEAAPIVAREDLKRHPFISFVEELLFAPQLDYPDLIGADVEPRIRSTNVLTQLHATLSGSGLCMLPAFVASVTRHLSGAARASVRSFSLHAHSRGIIGAPRMSGGCRFHAQRRSGRNRSSLLCAGDGPSAPRLHILVEEFVGSYLVLSSPSRPTAPTPPGPRLALMPPTTGEAECCAKAAARPGTSGETTRESDDDLTRARWYRSSAPAELGEAMGMPAAAYAGGRFPRIDQ
jgi:DNA-binding transcriptional LysR family regulator